ncbi:MAG: OsmC family protein [Sediminibacterium sp.]|nr:OsmC family protein [Sediminibacterium sp.]
MAVRVQAGIGVEKYFTKVSAGTNTIITDEPIDKGGGNKGFNPYEVLAASLASCTAATLRMYIDRKQWQVGKINVEVVLENDPQNHVAHFKRYISYEDAQLDETQEKRLLAIAEACPVHKLLNGAIHINTFTS